MMTQPILHADPRKPVAADALSRERIVQLYHRNTMHRFEGYAAGPSLLDWDLQPAPFRHYPGTVAVHLPLIDELPPGTALRCALERPFGQSGPLARPLEVGLDTLGVLLQLSFGITAWKSLGPDRWALRANPSSGNLHPVEAWLITRGVKGLADGVHHYRPEDHALECRASDPAAEPAAAPQVLIALSSAMWRETWKYGERAFRYCQLDVGHALGALRHAAAPLGWDLCAQAQVGSATLAARLGLDRADDYPARRSPETEVEEAEVLLALSTGAGAPPAIEAAALRRAAQRAHWHGRASTLDPRPLYRWPIVGEVAAATRRNDGELQPLPARKARPAPTDGTPSTAASALILQRRSAQRFDRHHIMHRADFVELLAAIGDDGVCTGLVAEHRITPVLFVHRVEGVEPGLYLLPRNAADPLLARLQRHFPEAARPGPVDGLGLRLLQRFDAVQLHRLARSLHCHQDLAANACVAFGLLAPFDSAIAADPAAYRELHRAAGLVGHELYLQAEAIGLRGTGIGCYFDTPVLDLLGLEGSDFRTLYHFTVGRAVTDKRIETTPAYPADRRRATSSEDTA